MGFSATRARRARAEKVVTGTGHSSRESTRTSTRRSSRRENAPRPSKTVSRPVASCGDSPDLDPFAEPACHARHEALRAHAATGPVAERLALRPDVSSTTTPLSARRAHVKVGLQTEIACRLQHLLDHLPVHHRAPHLALAHRKRAAHAQHRLATLEDLELLHAALDARRALLEQLHARTVVPAALPQRRCAGLGPRFRNPNAHAFASRVDRDIGPAAARILTRLDPHGDQQPLGSDVQAPEQALQFASSLAGAARTRSSPPKALMLALPTKSEWITGISSAALR